jgi:hypothetical protein
LPFHAALPHQESTRHTHNASWRVSRFLGPHHVPRCERARPRRNDALLSRAWSCVHTLSGFGQWDAFPWHVVGRGLLCRVRLGALWGNSANAPVSLVPTCPWCTPALTGWQSCPWTAVTRADHQRSHGGVGQERQRL